MDMHAGIARIASYRIHQSLVQKPLRIEDYWPMWSDKKRETEGPLIMTKEILAEIKKAHKIK